MKKQLLTALALCGLFVSANAQTFSAGATGYTIDFTGASATQSSCLLNSAPNAGGIAAAGGDLTNAFSPRVGGLATTTGPLELISKATLAGESPAFFYLTTTVGSGTTAQCKELNNLATGAAGVNMSANYKVAITVKASVAADLNVWLGTVTAGGFYPASSTYNTGAATDPSIIKTISVGTSYSTIEIDFSEVAAEKATFDAWAGRTMVNQIGFTSKTAGATFEVSKVVLGSAVTSTNAAILPSTAKIGPNPSSSEINVTDIDVTSMKLMNLNGAVVREVSSSSVSVEGLTSGIYFLQVNGYKPVKVMVK